MFGETGFLHLFSPTPVHFPIYNCATLCPLLAEDLGNHMDIWKLCLIGYDVGKPFRHIALTKFMSSVWQCTVSLTFHDPGWLIFKFFSEANMLGVT